MVRNVVKKHVEALVDVLKQWDSVRAIVLQHFAERDVYDPSFSVTLDVFRNGDIPDRDRRSSMFPQAQYFETSQIEQKDRFLFDDLPIRISYKNCDRVDRVLSAVSSNQNWLSLEHGTYLFHRIATGTIVWKRDEWIDSIRDKLDRLPDTFWIEWMESCKRRLDHFLSDMGAAAIKDDTLYSKLSLASFLKVAAELLFSVNRVFEPGPRDYRASLDVLEKLPDGFNASWASLLRDDSELPTDRKCEIAGILAKTLFMLEP